MIKTEMRLAARLGISVLRVEFPWPLIETSQGVFDWHRSDVIVRTAARFNLQLQPVLVYTPSWAGPSPQSSPSNSQFWPAFVWRTINRYKSAVHYWEMWNEPDSGGYWADGTRSYVQNVLLPGYAAAKSADPSSQVLLGEPYFADTPFLNDIYNYGGGNAFDIVGFHEYANVLSQGGVQSDINTVQGILSSHGQVAKPIWIGEYGADEGSDTTADTKHATAIKIMMQYVHGYQVANWYNLRDDYAMGCCPPVTLKAAYWGLVQHDDVTIKQGYVEFQSILSPAK